MLCRASAKRSWSALYRRLCATRDTLCGWCCAHPMRMDAFAFETCNVRCPHNPLGVKGAGEAGAIGSCPAVMNAIIDALISTCQQHRVRLECNPSPKDES